jgi:hypothetical protein
MSKPCILDNNPVGAQIADRRSKSQSGAGNQFSPTQIPDLSKKMGRGSALPSGGSVQQPLLVAWPPGRKRRRRSATWPLPTPNHFPLSTFDAWCIDARCRMPHQMPVGVGAGAGGSQQPVASGQWCWVLGAGCWCCLSRACPLPSCACALVVSC